MPKVEDLTIPQWLTDTLNSVSECYDYIGDIGWEAVENDGWEVRLYPMPTEFEGVAGYGANIRVELADVQASFDVLGQTAWAYNRDAGQTYISIEGVIEGADVWLRLYEFAPEDAQPSCRWSRNGRIELIPDPTLN